MTLSVLAAFWAVSFLFIITPGADWAYAISAGMRGRLVTPAVAGMLSGHLLATVIVAAGVGGLVARNPMILSVLTVAGALYLLWLGVCMLRDPATPQSGQGQASDSWSRWAWKGLRCQAAAVEVVVDGLAKVHAAGEHAQGQFDQGFPAQWRVAKAEEALVVEQAHAGFAQGQGVETFGVQALEVRHAEVQSVAGKLFEDLLGA